MHRKHVRNHLKRFIRDISILLLHGLDDIQQAAAVAIGFANHSTDRVAKLLDRAIFMSRRH
jgi:hypothetical protein